MANTQSLKGFRDFLPEDMAIQNYIFDVWRETCQSFGFKEYNGPLLEFASLYQKSGEDLGENGKELYKFKDQGGREIALRPEMTPTVARMIAQHSASLPKPVRWFSIGQFFRAEKPQKGRLREHFQLNADIFGSENVLADFEIITLALQVLSKIGAKNNMYKLKINNRNFVDAYFKKIMGIDDKLLITKLIRIIDASPKYSKMWLKTKLEELGDDKLIQKVEDYLNLDWEKLQSIDFLETHDLISLIKLLKDTDYSDAIDFDPSIARGFDYYTGMVFEVFDTNPESNRSLFGGGRYDDLTSMFDEKSMPAVGFGQGDVTLRIFLENWGLLPKTEVVSTDFLVTVFSKELQYYSVQIVSKLRKEGLSSLLHLNPEDNISKQLDYANKNNIKFTLIAGEEEVKENSVTIKNMQTGEQYKIELENLINKLYSLL